MVVSSQIRPACPCSTQKKGLSCKGSDRPYRVREIHFTNTVPFAAKVSLQQFVSSLTNGHSRPLAGYNNVSNICIQLNLSVLISSIAPAFSTETAFLQKRWWERALIKRGTRGVPTSFIFKDTASAPTQTICFPQGGWQLHRLIVNDKPALSHLWVRGWLPAECLPDSCADAWHVWNVYISLSLRAWPRATPTAARNGSFQRTLPLGAPAEISKASKTDDQTLWANFPTCFL